MRATKSQKRLDRIETAYLKALGDRFPEVAFRSSVWHAEFFPAILAAVPDASHEEIVAMFKRMTRRHQRAWREFQKRPHLWQAPNWPDWLPIPDSVDDRTTDSE